MIKHGTWCEACHQRHLEFIFLHEVCFQFGHPIAFSLIRRWKILKWKICFATISGGECSGGKSADVTSNLRTFIGWPIGSLWDQELVGMWKPRQGAQDWWRLTHLNEEFKTQYLRNDKNTEHVYYVITIYISFYSYILFNTFNERLVDSTWVNLTSQGLMVHLNPDSPVGRWKWNVGSWVEKIVVVQGELSLRFSEIRHQFMDSMNGIQMIGGIWTCTWRTSQTCCVQVAKWLK